MEEVLAGRRRWAVACTDALAGLRAMPSESVACVVTSVPYYGLRDYGTGRWEGGDPGCEHKVRPSVKTDTSTLGGGKATTGHQREGYRGVCGRCGAVRIDQQIGLEDTLSAYLERLVGVFAEVRRVLREDGTCWVNCGDSYAGGGGGNYGAGKAVRGREGVHLTNVRNRPAWLESVGMKPKDLMGVPWRLAFALQADGWYLRSDVIWAKPNPMPESVTDRPTKAHEYVFLLTKSERYRYDNEAIKEEAESRAAWVPNSDKQGVTGMVAMSTSNGRRYTGFNARWNARVEAGTAPTKRNKRTVWTIPTEAFPEAHFATFPPALVEPCVLAGCPKDGIVLDPFAGSGTTLMVALRHDRRAVGLELNPVYADMARRRIEADCPMFNQEVPA